MNFSRKILLPHQFYYPHIKTVEDRSTLNKQNTFIHSLEQVDNVKKNALIYIHIPFCDSKCSFCSFDKSYLYDLKEKYIHLLLNEMKRYSELPYIKSLSIQGIHIGGGTPTLLTSYELELIIKKAIEFFQITKKIQINMEGSATSIWRKDILELLESKLISRVSVGVQSFNPFIRKFFHPTATLENVYYTLNILHQHKISTYVDIMYGYPHIEGVDEKTRVLDDIQKASSFEVDGIEFGQLYPFYNEIQKYNELNYMKTEELIDMMSVSMNLLQNLGYYQETQYGFVRDSNIILENAYYGNGDDDVPDCIGIGSGAWGMLNGYKYRNNKFGIYIKKNPLNYLHLKKLTKRELSCLPIVGFPKRLSLNKNILSGHPYRNEFLDKISQLVQLNMVSDKDNYFVLTLLGKCYIDNIYFELLSQEEQEDVKSSLLLHII